MINIILLAAGESRRMGAQNKLLLPFGDQPLIAHMIDQLLPLEDVKIIVVLGHEAQEVKAVLKNRKVTFVMNPNYQKGMTTSIQAGVQVSDSNTKGYMICLSDLPLIRTTDYQKIIKQFQIAYNQNKSAIAIPFYKKQKGNPIIFSSKYKAVILKHKDMEGCKTIVQRNVVEWTKVEMDNHHILRDMDTPEDYLSF